jgi:tetratricopeptide (TPR) repeat protein
MAKVSLRAYNREIETMIDRGQLDEAIAHCHHILKTFPKHLDTYRLLGKAYLETKRYGDAADIFTRILASVPNDFVAQVGMSIIRDEENKLDDAIWHMERAFETQPSNPAIQSELQRLYGRRDGVQPPRIRMTRGALAHMYVQGELYPQAMSEIRSVLKDDAQRADMQALLALACFRSGAKNEAADVASALLRRYPYSLDANRVLAEIFGVDRPENAQLYRQRVVELDPYAAQVTGTMFQSNEVPEAAVSVDRLDWNGQPISMQPDWRQGQAISLENEEGQPEWLKGALGGMTSPSQPTPASIFDNPAPAQPTSTQPIEEIPDFMKAAGWGQSTGTFDESKSVFNQEESAPDAQPIEQGDLPDWVKAMKPPEPEPATSSQADELPDWIHNIDKGVLSSPASTSSDRLNQSEQPAASAGGEQADWMGQLEQPASPVGDQFDWLNQTAQNESTIPLASDDQPAWRKNLGTETTPASAAAQEEEPDWLKGFGTESDITPQPAQTETPDWLKGLGNEPAAASTEEESDWLEQFGREKETASTEAASASPDLDFLNQLTEEPVLETPDVPVSAVDVDKLGTSEQERDDSFAWLESLAAKQGASEGLLTKPEERREEEPEWVKQAKGLGSTQAPTPVEPTISETAVNFEDISKTEQEQDDSFAWLENLAAKQGATEGPITGAEERREDELEWMEQAKGLEAEQPSLLVMPESKPDSQVQQPAPVDEVEAWLQNLEGERRSEPETATDETAMWLKSLEEEDTKPHQPITRPAVNLEELGKSEQERDDSFAWLESLAAKQGATEGLLTKPEERLEQEPEWVRQAKDLGTQPPSEAITPETQPEQEQAPAMDETGAWLRSLEEEEKPAEPVSAVADDTATWLESLEAENLPKPEPAADETAMWLKNLDQTESVSETAQAVEPVENELPAWLQDVEGQEAPATELNIPSAETRSESQWQATAEEPVATGESQSQEQGIPSWLAELDKEEERPASSAADEDLPAWLRAEETAPEATERTRPSDWQPEEDKQPEIIYSPPLAEPEPPKIIYSPPLEETEQPAPIAFETSQEASLGLPEELRVQPVREVTPSAPSPESVAATPSVEPPQERVPSRVPGVMVPSVDPILGSARNEISRNNISGALDSYARLIKKGRFLEEVIYDLRDASYRYPVEVNIWQSLGDAYMRANRLQDALDAYTKAEELLR